MLLQSKCNPAGAWQIGRADLIQSFHVLGIATLFSFHDVLRRRLHDLFVRSIPAAVDLLVVMLMMLVMLGVT